MKALLITSDDFGMTESVNQGIEEALRRGSVTATNLMVPCPSFLDAARRVKEHSLPSGIHLTLTSEWDQVRWRSLTGALSLRAPDGAMRRTFADFPSTLTRAEIRAEFDAQLTELRRQGIEPTHVDTHMIASESNSWAELLVKSVVKELCEAQGLIYTYEIDRAGALVHFASETHLSLLSVTEFKERLCSLGAGIHHVISHCAVDGEDLRALDSTGNPWSREYRIKDHSLLTDPKFAEFLRAEDFQLIAVKDLTAVKDLSAAR